MFDPPPQICGKQKQNMPDVVWFLDCAPKNWGSPKIAPKGRFLGPIYVSDQNSKEFLKNLKYFLGFRPIFEKKCAKKG